MPTGEPGPAPGSMIRTREGLITYWSHEMQQRYGFPAEEALGRTSYGLLRPKSWQALSEIEAILNDRSEWNGGLILHRMDGQPVVVANYWHLHSDTADGGPLVTEVHSDIVLPGTPASSELADIVATIAQELSQPLSALGGFIGGTQRSVEQAWLNRDVLHRGLADATAQLSRASEILHSIRALGETLRNPRLREVHARFVAAVAKSTHLSQEEVTRVREAITEQAFVLQNIQVYRRRLASTGSDQPDEQTKRVLRRLLAEEEAKVAALRRRDTVSV